MKIEKLKEIYSKINHAAADINETELGLIFISALVKIDTYFKAMHENYVEYHPVEHTERIMEYVEKRKALFEEVCDRNDDGTPIMINGQYKINKQTATTTLLKEKEISLDKEYEEDLKPYKLFDKAMYWIFENHKINDEETKYLFGPEIKQDVVFSFPLWEDVLKNIKINLE